MSLVLYIGLTIGLHEAEVRHMYFWKWSELYRQYRKHHNMVIKKQIYMGV